MTVTGRAGDEPLQGSRGPAWLRRAITWGIDWTADKVWVRYVAAGAVVLFVVGTSVAIIVNIQTGDAGDTSRTLLSYLGLAFVCFTCCAVPIPGIATVLYAMVIYCGYALNPLVVAAVAGPAMALGEGVSWLLGAMGLRIAERSKDDDDSGEAKAPSGGVRGFINQLASHVDEWMDKRGFITLLVLAAVPNPIVAFANLAAGASGMPFWRFYLAVAIGKTIRSLVLAGIGVWLGTIL